MKDLPAKRPLTVFGLDQPRFINDKVLRKNKNNDFIFIIKRN